MSEQFKNPEEDFVKFFTSRVYEGVQTPKVKAQFLDITSKALKQFLNDSINDRLKFAIGNDQSSVEESPTQPINIEQDANDIADKTSKIVTTEEVDGFNIIKAILRSKVDVSRITHRDTQSYFGILLDNNNRKTLCRLHFNAKQKYLGVISDNKKEIRHPIANLDELYNHSELLLETSSQYL